MDKHGQVWTSLDKFGQVWTSLVKFGQSSNTAHQIELDHSSTKILSFEITIFDLKMMVKSG